MSILPSPSRLEAFSDGVIAVIITIMVLEFKVPKQAGLAGFATMLPTLAVYALSFTFTGIYWINHHHVIDRLKRVDTLILWANLGFLFSLSLLPFFTNYLVEKHMDSFSVAVYAVSLFLDGSTFTLLSFAIVRHLRLAGRVAGRVAERVAGPMSGQLSGPVSGQMRGQSSGQFGGLRGEPVGDAEEAAERAAAQLAEQRKGWVSLLMYLVAVPMAYWRPHVALTDVGLVTLIWIIPTFGVRQPAAGVDGMFP